MAANDGEHPVRDLFGVPLPDGSGAPGSPGISWHDTNGGTIGNPVVSVQGMSSQLESGRPKQTVAAGDTSGMSDDIPCHTSPIMPGPQDEYLSTGAGEGDGTSKIARYSWQQSNSPGGA